jgi:hypothetical protein
VSATIPELERELVAAARRLAGETPAAEPTANHRAAPRGPWRLRGSRRPGSGALALAIGFVLAAGTAAAVLSQRGEVGGEPTRGYGRDAPEADIGVHYRTRPVVIATGRLPDGEPFEIVGYQQSSPAGGQDLCIDTQFPRRGEGHGCGSNSGYAQSVSRGPGHPTTVTGATTAETRRVLVHYRDGEQGGSVEAALELVTDADVLTRIQVDEPFGFYVAELPEGARDIAVEGIGAGGRVLWDAVFPGEVDYLATKRIRDPYLRLKR